MMRNQYPLFLWPKMRTLWSRQELTHPAKHGVLVVQPGRGHSGDEELGPIGAGARVGHGQGEWPIMPQAPAELILKLSAPDALASRPIPCTMSSRVSAQAKPFQNSEGAALQECLCAHADTTWLDCKNGPYNKTYNTKPTVLLSPVPVPTSGKHSTTGKWSSKA